MSGKSFLILLDMFFIQWHICKGRKSVWTNTRSSFFNEQ